MKKFLYLFFTFVVVALLSSCEKDPVAPPDPDPDPHANPVIEIQVEFQKPDNMALGCNQFVVVSADRTTALQAIEFKEPISTVRLTGDMALELAGKKAYIYIGITRGYYPVFSGLTMQKAIDPLVVLPGINKLVIVVSPDLTTPQQEIDP